MAQDRATPVSVDPKAQGVVDWLERQIADVTRVGATILELEGLASSLTKGGGSKSVPLGNTLKQLCEQQRTSLTAFLEKLQATTEVKAPPPAKGGEQQLSVVAGTHTKTGS